MEIEGLVLELGELYSLEVEASAFPEIAGDAVIQEVHMAVLRATGEIQRATAPGKGNRLEAARNALASAQACAHSARVLLVHARAARNRNH